MQRDHELDQIAMLISELIEPKHVPLYLHNATFHSDIVRLAQSLPTLVEALAAQAQAKETEQQAQYIALMQEEMRKLEH